MAGDTTAGCQAIGRVLSPDHISDDAHYRESKLWAQLALSRSQLQKITNAISVYIGLIPIRLACHSLGGFPKLARSASMSFSIKSSFRNVPRSVKSFE